MVCSNENGIISSAFSLLPNQMSYLLISSKHLITQQLQLCLLIIVNGDKDNAFIRQQLLGYL